MVKIFLMRHGESKYNEVQAAINPKDEYGKYMYDVKATSESLMKLKKDASLINCDLTEKGKIQAANAATNFENLGDIKHVALSPMLRCIGTFEHLFENIIKNDMSALPKIKFFNESREILNASCDIGLWDSEKKRKLLLNNLYDWKTIDSNPLWFLDSLCKKKFDEVNKQFTDGMSVQDKTNTMLEFFSTFPPENRWEDYGVIRERLEIFKKNLKEYCLENKVKDGELMVISHSRTLQTLTCEEFNQEGKPIDGKYVFLANAKIMEWNFDF